MYVGFYESIAGDPKALLRDVFAFLNVGADVELTGFPVAERIQPGPAKELPLRWLLPNHLLRDRTAELEAFLGHAFSWSRRRSGETTPFHSGDSLPADLPAFRREWDDDYLSAVLDQEQAFRSASPVVEENHLGYRIVLCRGRLFAMAPSCSHRHPAEVGARK